MPYKTILVHADDAENAAARIALAADLAIADDAHLIGSAMTGISRFLFETMGKDAPGIEPYLKSLRQRAERMLDGFEEIVRRAGVNSFERRLTDDEALGCISIQARYCDLVVLGQYDPEGAAPSTYANLPEYVTMNSGCPVLVVPYAHTRTAPGRFPRRVLIAWNGSIEAKKAIHDAIPLLRRAELVQVVMFNRDIPPDVHGEQPGADIALFLARHGIKVDVLQEQTDTDIGEALLSLANTLDSDLLVMGCYGHARVREVFLGGATRTVLRSMTIPVMMSH